ncbi:MAG: flagellar motor protein MotP [Bacillota bacterium]|uniref:Flagellar motor protein MotP n=1 Tax=Virgibacillus salarius TaxID=447199 RepID=A0A941ID75_9BACI|nr:MULTISPECIES: flagellar motor protein MotP [Bacillaceae]NAZ10964.1 flagellar motor protein MotP [Agaribacter marinus]MBR7798256.1 flagellar motor protein MotP [Virgibacillus salarius]MCC2252628.1 flagellar motor protein MotP [Virgibacillus sp. AGTR]MDY7046599.1 flagellar motor protein MotP [Virgibacillus sp. M23]QRZ17731.1 flagellar motor protein MotP [Virgibacillus sp. AGTR]
MRKRDILTPIGITLGFIMIMLAIVSKSGTSGASIFMDISSIFIVIGGLVASMLINFKMEQIKLTRKVLSEAFHKNDQRLPELIGLFVRLSERARREGILALENELEEVEDPFIKKGILLAVDGIEPEVIKDIMDAEITAVEDRHYRGRSLIEKAGEYAPAWGMIGTLVGLVLMLNNLQDPSTLGPSMAVALLTTLYGTVLSNLVFIPMASKLESKTEEEVFLKQIIIEGVIGVQSGQNPRILEEKLSAFLSNESKAKQESDDSAKFVEESIHEA